MKHQFSSTIADLEASPSSEVSRPEIEHTRWLVEHERRFAEAMHDDERIAACNAADERVNAVAARLGGAR